MISISPAPSTGGVSNITVGSVVMYAITATTFNGIVGFVPDGSSLLIFQSDSGDPIPPGIYTEQDDAWVFTDIFTAGNVGAFVVAGSVARTGLQPLTGPHVFQIPSTDPTEFTHITSTENTAGLSASDDGWDVTLLQTYTCATAIVDGVVKMDAIVSLYTPTLATVGTTAEGTTIATSPGPLPTVDLYFSADTFGDSVYVAAQLKIDHTTGDITVAHVDADAETLSVSGAGWRSLG